MDRVKGKSRNAAKSGIISTKIDYWEKYIYINPKSTVCILRHEMVVFEYLCGFILTFLVTNITSIDIVLR